MNIAKCLRVRILVLAVLVLVLTQSEAKIKKKFKKLIAAKLLLGSLKGGMFKAPMIHFVIPVNKGGGAHGQLLPTTQPVYEPNYPPPQPQPLPPCPKPQPPPPVNPCAPQMSLGGMFGSLSNFELPNFQLPRLPQINWPNLNNMFNNPCPPPPPKPCRPIYRPPPPRPQPPQYYPPQQPNYPPPQPPQYYPPQQPNYPPPPPVNYPPPQYPSYHPPRPYPPRPIPAPPAEKSGTNFEPLDQQEMNQVLDDLIRQAQPRTLPPREQAPTWAADQASGGSSGSRYRPAVQPQEPIAQTNFDDDDLESEGPARVVVVNEPEKEQTLVLHPVTKPYYPTKSKIQKQSTSTTLVPPPPRPQPPPSPAKSTKSLPY